ncbi:Fucose 4-O-acetylase [Devosia sp. YR412]|uniref:acyltransferase family protein n=1 Tax=Devosia sp. YR412 TaxID=1881030 RepID=UPI0008B8883D|nr:acyltransferase family protein [Devosia sp. YR412]SEQ32605.1 Fucose 4-O-acetylase [Devosia sp. YR412]
MSSESNNSRPRDVFLDCAKGLAILLVIMGHNIQAGVTDFDANLAFRLIYSFHMPFFFFISGMVTAPWFIKFTLSGSTLDFQRGVLQDVFAKARRLVLPYFVWALVAYIFLGYSRDGTFVDRLTVLVKRPDEGLWFLIALFEITIFLYLVGLLVRFSTTVAHRCGFAGGGTQLAMMIGCGILGYLALKMVPLEAAGLAKVHFPNFYAGLIFAHLTKGRMPASVPLVAALIFMALAPAWHRLGPPDFLIGVPLSAHFTRAFGIIVALSGSLAMLGIARFATNNLPRLPLSALTLIGRHSLDIYALHFYFLVVWPPVLGPLVSSLLVSTALRVSRWTALIFFGEKLSAKTWIERSQPGRAPRATAL